MIRITFLKWNAVATFLCNKWFVLNSTRMIHVELMIDEFERSNKDDRSTVIHSHKKK